MLDAGLFWLLDKHLISMAAVGRGEGAARARVDGRGVGEEFGWDSYRVLARSVFPMLDADLQAVAVLGPSGDLSCIRAAWAHTSLAVTFLKNLVGLNLVTL